MQNETRSGTGSRMLLGAGLPVVISGLLALSWCTVALTQTTTEHPQVVNPHGLPAPVASTNDNSRQAEASLLTNIRQLTFAGQRAGEGYFSQDGSLLIFQSERDPDNPFFQMYVMNLTTGETRRVSPGYGKTTCGWIHPDRQHVLFASTHLDPQARAKQKEERDKRAAGHARRYTWDFDEQYDLFQTDLTGGHLTALTQIRGYDAEASWSPDGSLIALTSNRHAYTESLSQEDQATFARDPSSQLDIYVMHADGSQVRRLTTAPGYDGGPFFSPDGKKICWRRFSPDGVTAEVFIMNVDGSEQTQLTRLGAMSWAPFFHPSGEYLIFATNVHGSSNFELYLVDTAGKSSPVRVTYTDGFDGLPAFAPEGSRLAWTSSRTSDKKAQICFADWNQAEARRRLGIESTPAINTTSAPASPRAEAEQTRTAPTISMDELKHHLTTLAAQNMDGRLTGTEGERAATNYVASVFRTLGLVPAGDDSSFFQEFTFTAGVSLGANNHLTLQTGDHRGPQEYVIDQEWRPLAFAKPGTFDLAEVVFAGYGIVAPAAPGQEEYDSFAHLDVTDKWVLVFRYLPEGVTPEVRQHLNRYATLRYKAMSARDRGARGIIVVSGPNAQVKEPLVPLIFDASLAATSLAAVSVTDQLAAQWLKPTGKTLKELQDVLDTGKPVMGFSLAQVKLAATIDIQQEKRTGRNALARLPANEGVGDTAVVVGAHVDHLGHGVGAASLARGDEKGMIHYGADDNASGVAGMLEIAHYLTDRKAQGTLPLQHDVLFAAWSGEELGLLGSSHFVRTFGNHGSEPSTLRPGLVAYLNMDMIGRLDKTLILQGVGSSTNWLAEIERQNVAVGLPIVIQNDSYLPTDATSFYLKGVPILSAFTGAHVDYHTPRDTADKINYPGAAKVTSLLAALTSSVATRVETPDYQRMERPATTLGRGGLRAYLGTIPDYSQGDISGVKLSGVTKGGPAERAGVQSGDTIVELAGKKIENIYDYTYALDAAKIGTPIDLVVLRGDQRLTLTVTPESRE
jgi:Tol biopolymer transport system component